MDLMTALSQQISQATGTPFKPNKQTRVGGGCINNTFRINDDKRTFFVKTNHADQAHMFAAEVAGLETIISSHTLRAPVPICHGIADGYAYLVLEHIAFGQADAQCADILGEKLAAMHQVTAPEYGWTIDNTIGATPQHNTRSKDWIHFLATQRLDFQFDLAEKNGAHFGERRHKLLDALPVFFMGYRPLPSLLHGDLWGGNWQADDTGNPVIFDPAVYYGDREADLAMTELFGGFPARFYQSYQAHYPLDAEYATRKALYNLYHVLNHFNMFGGGYRHQAEHMIDQLLSSV